MEETAVRVERTPTGRRVLWPPLRRRHDVAVTLPLRSVEDLFAAPSVDPFSPDYETYPDKPGVDAIAGVLHAERPVAGVGVTIELSAHDVDDMPARQAPEAIKRYCRVKIGDLDQDLHLIHRYGLWALAIGALAVLVLNAIANPLDSTDDDFLQLISQGLQIAAWVTLWFPINLLVYDRWFARRDQAVYRDMLQMQVQVVTTGRHEA
jgi:hypothetical protein